MYGTVPAWLTARLDPDGNGLLVGQLPGSLAPSVDPDGDGVPNSGSYGILDNCLGIANADQADLDCDGRGDVCDGSILDRDLDGVLGAFDNCAFTFNPDQANCDIDRETLASAALQGDACDAYPCPSTRAEVVDTATASGGSTVRVADSSIFEGVPSVGRAWTGDIFLSAVDHEVWMQTGFRRCACLALAATAADSPETRALCDLECPRSPAHYESSAFWTPPTVTFLNGVYPGSPTATGEIVVGYRGYRALRADAPDRFAFDWDFEADVAETVTAMPLGTSRSSTRSLFWTYAVDQTAPPAGQPPLCDAPGGACGTGSGDEHSDYWSGTVTRWTGLPLRTVPDVEPWTIALFPEQICPECLGHIPVPLITARRCFDASICTGDLRVRLPNVELPLSNELGQLLRTEMGVATRTWVPAIQSRDALTAGAARVVAIDPAARAITLAVYATPSAAPTALEGVRPGQGGTTLAFSGASGITGAAYLLDGNGASVTMIGGTTNGVPATTFRRMNLVSRAQTTVSIAGTAPGTVLAATLHPFLPIAVMVDRPTGGAYRVFRVDLETGASTVVRSHSHTGTFNAWRLTALPTGEMVLGASRTDGTGHRVVTFSVALAALTERRAATGSGRIVGSNVFATDRGLTVPARIGTSAWVPVGYPYLAMPAALTGSLSASF